MKKEKKKPNKNVLVKFRTSDSFMKIVEEFREVSSYAKGRNTSNLLRWLILEGMVHYIPYYDEKNKPLKEKVQQLIHDRDY